MTQQHSPSPHSDQRPDEQQPEHVRDQSQSVPPTPEGDAVADEEETLRTDIGEWQEAPSPYAEPAQPEPIAERMSGTEDPSSDQPGEAGTGAARTAEGEIVRETDFYPSGLPGPKQDPA